jgi:hypothetical protein
MYAWIWRHLPFGRAGKIIGSIGLAVATASLLWYVVFPWAEPLLPFDDVQVTQQGDIGGPAGRDDAGVEPAPSGEPSLGDHDIPYNTQSNDPAPSETTPR